MEVEAACSGLRMLTIFVALCFAVVLLADFPMWQRIVIVLSSVPIALAVNIMRIVATGILFSVLPASQEKLKHFFHDGAGLVMMPLALLLLFLEYKIMSNLFVEDEDDLVQPLGLGSCAAEGCCWSGNRCEGLLRRGRRLPSAVPGRQATAKPAPITPIPAKPIAPKQQHPTSPAAGPRQSATNPLKCRSRTEYVCAVVVFEHHLQARNRGESTTEPSSSPATIHAANRSQTRC